MEALTHAQNLTNMSTTHYPEPWNFIHNSHYYEIQSEDRNVISVFGNEHHSAGIGACEATAARIVACVNALAGIEDPEAFVKEAKAALQKDKFPFL
jgi:hypothetical protein